MFFGGGVWNGETSFGGFEFCGLSRERIGNPPLQGIQVERRTWKGGSRTVPTERAKMGPRPRLREDNGGEGAKATRFLGSARNGMWEGLLWGFKPTPAEGAEGKGGWVGAGVGVSDGGPSLHAARAVAMSAANKPLRMVRRTPVQRLMSIRNISGSGGAVFARTVSAECFTEHFTGLNDSSCGRGHTYTGSSALCCWTSGASSP